MNNLPFFSIITPAYNAEKYILRCIKNLQINNVDFEHIIVDDCSTDSTVLKINEYIETNNLKNIKVIKMTKNSGPGLARNKALKESCGKYIIFCDADDFMFSNSLDIIEKNIMYNNEPDIMIFGYTLDNGLKKNTVLPKKTDKDFVDNNTFKKDYILDKIVSAPWGKVINKTLITNSGAIFPNFMNGEDAIFNLKIIMSSETCIYLRESLYYFDKTGESLTRKEFTKEEFILHKKSFNAFEKEMLDNNLFELYKEELIARKLSFLCINTISRLALTSKKYNVNIPNEVIIEIKKIALENKFYKSRYLSKKAKVLISLFIICPPLSLYLYNKVNT